MITLQKENIYECGNFLEADIFPTYRKAGQRRSRSKPTEEVQKALNAHNSAKRLERLENANFTCHDVKCELSFDPANEPTTPEETLRELQKFTRRTRAFLHKKTGKSLRYVAVIEKGSLKGHFHIHLMMSGGLSPNEIQTLWGRGYVEKIQPLRIDRHGLAGIAYYMSGNKRGQKIPALLYRRYYASRNLIIPQKEEHTGRIGVRTCGEIVRDENDHAVLWESMYPGWSFASLTRYYNPINGGYYLCVKMYKPPASLKKGGGRQ